MKYTILLNFELEYISIFGSTHGINRRKLTREEKKHTQKIDLKNPLAYIKWKCNRYNVYIYKYVCMWPEKRACSCAQASGYIVIKRVQLNMYYPIHISGM